MLSELKSRSKIDSLQELNSKLLAEISELRKENADVKAENTKLKQAMEENVELKSRIEELEKNRADSDAENVELRARVMKLEQDFRKSQTDISPEEDTSVDIPSSAIGQYVNANSSPISPEDKEVDEFVDSKYKEKVNNEIRERNREKKLQRESAGNQAQDLSQCHEITSRDMVTTPS